MSGSAEVPVLWSLYQVAFTLVLLLTAPRYLLHMWRRGGYRRGFAERFARYSPQARAGLQEPGRVWVHAVSVGELFVALQLIGEIRRRDPTVRFLITVTTSTARRIAEQRVRPPDVLVYFPLDYPVLQRRFLTLTRPRAVVIVETELWPNLIRETRRARVPLFLVNGRLSARSHRAYRWVRFLTRPLLPAFTCLYVQSEEDARRFLDLGAPSDRTRIVGSAKYDLPPLSPETKTEICALLRRAGFPPDVRYWIAASTWPGEEEAALELYASLRGELPNWRLIIAPRHVERREEVMRRIRKMGLSFIMRSELSDREPAASGSSSGPDVFLLDTTGELRRFYTVADLAFVGKSLTRHGGQNPVEPAAAGCAVVVGPHMENFSAIVREMREAGALVQVPDADEWRREVRRLLFDPDACRDLGRRAAAFVRDRAGALARTAEGILSMLESDS